jgi:methylglyoxal synthase
MQIALIANDAKKKLMVNLCVAYKHILAKHSLCATGSTGALIEEHIGLPIKKYLAGNHGGGSQLASEIAHNDIDMVIFLRDPNFHNQAKNMEADSITRLCDEHNIPIASNLSTAEVLLLALDRGDLNWRLIK